MKKCCFAGWIVVLSVFLLPLVAFAGGFAIDEQGAKAAGMANAFVAQANNPTAVYFNPAGIVQLDGTQVTVGASPVIPHGTFESTTADPAGLRGTAPGQKTNLDKEVITVPNAYMTQKISDRISFGFGIFSNFGLETNWPNDWEGRFIIGGTYTELTTLSLNPVVAFKPYERVSFAFGPVMQYLYFELKQKQPTPTLAVLDSKFEGDDVDWGWNAGLMIWLTDSIKFGASYRSEVSYSINGKLTLSPNAPGFPDTRFTSSIKTPANALLGLAWTHGSLTLEFDAQWTDWSSWNELKAEFNQSVGGQPGIDVEEDWHDTWAYRFGTQFAVNQYLDVRAGIAYDESPIPSRSISPRLFAGDLWYYTAGLGGHFKGFDADLAYQYVDVESRKMGSTAGNDQVTGVFGTPQLTGKFKDVDVHIIAFNLSYKF